MSDYVLALDVGGTKIAVGLVDADGNLTHHAQQPTPHADAEAIWSVAERLITDAVASADGHVRGVGIASAGPIDLASGTVSPINITAWQRFPIVERVTGVTGRPVRLGGDVLCLALGEQWRGAGRGAQFLLGMVVSTGIGGGLILDGAPYDGRTGNAGVPFKLREHALFICFAPADSPRYAAALVLEHNGHLIRNLDAPAIGRDIMTYLFDRDRAVKALAEAEPTWGGDIQTRMAQQEVAWRAANQLPELLSTKTDAGATTNATAVAKATAASSAAAEAVANSAAPGTPAELGSPDNGE